MLRGSCRSLHLGLYSGVQGRLFSFSARRRLEIGPGIRTGRSSTVVETRASARVEPRFRNCMNVCGSHLRGSAEPWETVGLRLSRRSSEEGAGCCRRDGWKSRWKGRDHADRSATALANRNVESSTRCHVVFWSLDDCDRGYFAMSLLSSRPLPAPIDSALSR